jgi:hypothetical protein
MFGMKRKKIGQAKLHVDAKGKLKPGASTKLITSITQASPLQQFVRSPYVNILRSDFKSVVFDITGNNFQNRFHKYELIKILSRDPCKYNLSRGLLRLSNNILNNYLSY